MKKFLAIVITTMLLVFICYKYGYLLRNTFSKITENNICYISKTDDKNFYIYKLGKWHKEFIKGVNIGAAKPAYFPGELAITKEEYKRWFKYIGDMNANSIRVYTILKPAFYEALYEYNKETLHPLYLFQGVWLNEEDILAIGNAQNPKIKNQFKSDTQSLIDIIHGNKTLPKRLGEASGIYTKDVSPYVAGWILGIEWDPEFVINTNTLNAEDVTYTGKYLYTENASPFEKFLCEIGNATIDYETSKYNMQRPLSFTNWVTTDMLSHPNEPMEKEDKVSVNTEHIKSTNHFKPGLFASYHIYPYYPDFMNYQHDYAAFKDPDGRINTYRAYLRDLIKEHTVPVLVSEFGVPASRGKAHDNIHMGFNQGNIDEKTQGEMNAFMLQNIYDEGYCGGLVFAWQDEWFKRSWNTMDLDLPDRRAYWSNPQTNEQEFGLLAFDPGSKKSISYIDGNPKEWKKDKPVIESENFKLCIKSDEKYLYLFANIPDFDLNKDKFILPIDTTPHSGNSFINGTDITLPRPADFLITIDGKENSKVTVDAYYDVFYYTYAKTLDMINTNKIFETQNSGLFNPIYLCLNKELSLPEDHIILPLSKYETGKLVFGKGNPKDKDYYSLSDFYSDGDNLEIRIPWQLLNVMDPSSKKIITDFYKDGINAMPIEGIYVGGILIRNNISSSSNMALYYWDKWDAPSYHERLKPSYDILKTTFKKIEGADGTLYVYYSIIVLGSIILFFYLYIIWVKTLERQTTKKIQKYETLLTPLIDTILNDITKGRYVSLLNKNSLIQDISKNKLKKQVVENRIIYYLENDKGTSTRKLSIFCEELGIINKEIKQLSKNNIYAKALACKKLGELRSQKAVPYLLRQIDSPSQDVTYNALLALAHIGDTQGFLKAFEFINSSTRLSERSLIEIVDSFAGNKADIYFKMMECDNEFVSCIFIKSAGSYKDEVLAERISRFLTSDSKEKIIAATKALGRMNNSKYINTILGLLENENWEIRAIAAKALGTFHDTTALPKLINVLSDKHWFARFNAANSILALDQTLSTIAKVFEGDDPFAKDIILSAMENNNTLSLVLDDTGLSHNFAENTVRLIRNYIAKRGDSQSE